MLAKFRGVVERRRANTSHRSGTVLLYVLYTALCEVLKARNPNTSLQHTLHLKRLCLRELGGDELTSMPLRRSK